MKWIYVANGSIFCSVWRARIILDRRAVVGGSHDDGESTASMMAYFGWVGKKEKYCLVNIYTEPVGRRKKRDIIMITESKYTHTNTHIPIYYIYIVSVTFRQPTRRTPPRFFPLLVSSLEWVPFYFNFLFISEANSRGTWWHRHRPTSSASTLRLISEIASAPQNRTPNKRRVSHPLSTTNELFEGLWHMQLVCVYILYCLHL